jgi:acetyl esterase/lipase
LPFSLLIPICQRAIVSSAAHLSPGTITHGNIPYANDTLKRHLLDIYLPPGAKGNLPLVVWIHGGAWMLNDKYSDMGYMKNTVKSFLDSGYALASIDYRYSTEAVFPARCRIVTRPLNTFFSMPQNITSIKTGLQLLVSQQVATWRHY